MTTTSTSTRVVQSYLTARDTHERLQAQPPMSWSSAATDAPPGIFVDPSRQFQVVEGVGGALTEASARVWQKLSPARQQELLRAYFDPVEGLGYSLCRSHIASCDFSDGNYGYAEEADDHDLRSFSVQRDEEALLPFLRAAKAAAGGSLKLLASPWSPPAWMKTTGRMVQGGKLRPECRATWARYLVRYIQAYEALGFPIWAITVQNEPMATQMWESCIYTAEDERDFVRDFLGPALEAAGLQRVHVVVWDHNRDLMVERASVIYGDPAAARYVWGLGFHWYVVDKFENVQLVHDAWPDKHLLFTEGCQEGGPHIGSWALGERYARSLINDFNRWTEGWIDWNVLLDTTGGPNHVNNLCSAPILADVDNDRLIYQNSYYYLGHFSRFVRPGARRILCATARDDMDATAFRNPDGSVVVVALNRTEQDMPYALRCGSQHAVNTLPARSIVTLLF
jgi:glucosylceramidase